MPDHHTSRRFFSPELRAAVESHLLPEIRQPAQYLGGEWGSVVKPPGSVRGRMCLAFPDLYTIGMSHYGLQLLYSVVNRRDDWACERVFAPAPEMEAMLRRERLPLYSLETFTPLASFDIIGFTLQYELAATGVLTILDLGNIPLRTEHRSAEHPLVIAGGPVAAEPEAFAPFIDAFVIGDGEEAITQVADAWFEVRGQDRTESLLALARSFSFLYVPSLYEVLFADNGRALTPKPKYAGIPEVICPAVVPSLEPFLPEPLRIVPNIETVQDRVAVEMMRGCPGRCKFCQSSAMKRPIRTLSPETIARCLRDGCAATGLSEGSLLSLSSSDYPEFDALLDHLHRELDGTGITLSLPSLRVNQLLKTVMSRLTTERSSGFTLAPEAALWEMRQRIGKPITDEHLFAGCRSGFENGFQRVKMYFMVGLPEETLGDITAILDLAMQVANLGREVRGRFPTVTVNVSNFVPKPHTPLERLGMAPREWLVAAHHTLKNPKTSRALSVKYHDVKTSWLEALIARGDRRIADVIEAAWRSGARLDAWSDHFRNDLWQEAITSTTIPVQQIVHEPLADTEELPWGHVRF